MADRTIKPDDTNDLVLQNNDGSAKLELNEDQTVKVTTGSDAGEDFTVNTSQLVVEGDTGRVGVGTATPSQQVHISGATPIIQMTDTDTGADSLITASNATGSLKIQCDNNNETGSSTFEVDIDGSQRMKVDSTGDMTITDGDLVIGTAGHGIDFSGAQTSATEAGTGTTSSEILDSFETGTWNPEYHSSGGAITATEDIQAGYYTKIGRLVHVFGRIRTDSLSGGSGTVYIQGLPFTAGSFERPSGTISTCSDFAGDMPSSLYVPSGQSYFVLLYRNASDGAALSLQVSDLGTGANANFCAFSVTYFV